MSEISELSAPERAKHYRDWALAAEGEARKLGLTAGAGLLLLARQWRALALRTEAEICTGPLEAGADPFEADRIKIPS
jgi:hypothetical protein